MEQDSAPAEGQTPAANSTDQGQAPDPPAADAPPPATGKTFDESYVKQLRGSEASTRVENKELKEKLSEYEDAAKSEVEKLSGKLAKANARADTAEQQLLRSLVAHEKQIPADAADLLTGSSREELEANADKILALTKVGAVAPSFDGGVREPAPEPDDPETAHAKLLATLFGRPTNP